MAALVPLGKILKAQGLRGEVKLKPYSDSLGVLRAQSAVWLRFPSGRLVTQELAACRPHQAWAVLRFKGVETRDEAERFREAEVCVDEALLPAPDLAEEEYYWFQIIGLSVVTEGGVRLGTVREILRTGGHDVYVVEGAREYLIPATEEVVRKIDLERQEMVISPLEGLLDL
ncbi:MAG: 16S rRNA processing protein RimM [Deltaproteobacteria bacterium]|nr:16S rRNA processing protein RimM [Deltaproteobacteria bacterium]MBI3079582.1 16S rRNA processing protein RimM [Deltaproteobacteria bacterium]